MKKQSASVADIALLFDEVQRIVDLVARVVAKFPKETLPLRLVPFAGRPRVGMARPSTKGDGELVLQTALGLGRDQLRIPAAWLAMQDSQITAAVREIYWGDKNYRAMRELYALGTSIETHERQAALHKDKAIREQQEHDRLAARISKRMQAAEAPLPPCRPAGSIR